VYLRSDRARSAESWRLLDRYWTRPRTETVKIHLFMQGAALNHLVFDSNTCDPEMLSSQRLHEVKNDGIPAWANTSSVDLQQVAVVVELTEIMGDSSRF